MQNAQRSTYDEQRKAKNHGYTRLYLNFSNPILIHNLDLVLLWRYDQPLRDFDDTSLQSGEALLHRGFGVVIATPWLH